MVPIPNPCLTVAFLDAGQGDCLVIRFPQGTVWLVDCGSSKNPGVVTPEIETALKRLLPASGNVARLVLTHADIDHYNLLGKLLAAGISFGHIDYGCHLSLYNAVPAIRTYLDGMKRQNKTWSPGPYYYGGGQPAHNVEGVDVWWLAANAAGSLKKADGPTKNGNSIVLLLQYGITKIFLMGDATKDTESFILNTAQLTGTRRLLSNVGTQRGDTVLGGTLLKLGHHGSDTSSTRAWIRELRPDSLIVSSDTKTWGGSGIPDVAHVKNILQWTDAAAVTSHEVVMFDKTLAPPAAPTIKGRPRPTGMPPVRLKPTRQPKRQPKGRFNVSTCGKAFVTTLNDVAYFPQARSPRAAGHSWYWYVGADGKIAVIPTEALPA